MTQNVTPAEEKLSLMTTSNVQIRIRGKVSDLLCELGVDYEYEGTSFAYTIQHLYTPDFVLPNGVVLETKGYWRPEDRRKVRQVIERES